MDSLHEIDPQFAARIGRVLRDKWRLDALIGVGGTAAVYAATHRNGNRVAVKILRAELSSNEEVRARFLREAYAANGVGHPGAVAVLDDDRDVDGSAFLVMELLEGESLMSLVDGRGPLPLRDALDHTRATLDVLASAHAKGIVHRDIKPENLFLTKDGAIKVLDFGIARLAPTNSLSTLPGAAMGTPAFMPPEQARGHWDSVDTRSDVWAVGATLLYLLSARFIHEAPTLNELLLAAMTAPAKPARTFLPDAPQPLCDLIDRALAFEKEPRFADAAAMRDALDIVLADANTIAVGPNVLRRREPSLVDSAGGATLTLETIAAPAAIERPTKRRALAAGIAAGVLVIGALALFSTVGGHASPSSASTAAVAAAPSPVVPVAATTRSADVDAPSPIESAAPEAATDASKPKAPSRDARAVSKTSGDATSKPAPRAHATTALAPTPATAAPPAIVAAPTPAPRPAGTFNPLEGRN